MNILSNFTERLSELIFDSPKNAEQISEETGIAYTTLNHYLTGRYLPTLENTVRLADFFNCTTDFLLGLTAESHEKTFKACPPFSERFSEICKANGVSRYKIRQDTKLAESAMRYWVQGKTVPTIANIVRLANYFDCSVDYLIGREN